MDDITAGIKNKMKERKFEVTTFDPWTFWPTREVFSVVNINYETHMLLLKNSDGVQREMTFEAFNVFIPDLQLTLSGTDAVDHVYESMQS